MTWKKIECFPNYSVSNTGLVRNDDTGKLVKSYKSSTGYSITHLSKDKRKYNVKIHRIVAQAFIPNQRNERCVNHINGNKQDNRVENLEWCSHSWNNIHSYRTLGRSSINAITAMAAANLKPVVCVESGIVYGSIKEAANRTGALRGNISLCLAGKRSTAGGYHWRYAT